MTDFKKFINLRRPSLTNTLLTRVETRVEHYLTEPNGDGRHPSRKFLSFFDLFKLSTRVKYLLFSITLNLQIYIKRNMKPNLV